MGNYVLGPVYEKIYGKRFCKTSFEDRLELQKSIYLLQELGISAGDYDFMWYKHGPYSQNLQNDILDSQSNNIKDIYYSNDAEIAIQALKKAICRDDIKYDIVNWSECLGSMHYLRENILPSCSEDEEIISKLEELKPHLNNHEDNVTALKTLNELFA